MGAAATLIAPIFFIDFDFVKTQTTLPSFADFHKELVTIDEIDRINSLIVFVSYSWLRKHRGDPGYEVHSHPDNTNNDMLRLIKAGIPILFENYCKKLKKIYIWMDYSCVYQDYDDDSSTTRRRNIDLEKIMRLVDCLYTPLFHAKDIDSMADLSIWNKDPRFHWFDSKCEKKLNSWHDQIHGFIKRSWCRLEVFYNLNIEADKQIEKSKLCDNCMKHFLRIGSRPHFVFNGISKTGKVGLEHLIRVPTLSNKYLSELNPIHGLFSRHYDKEVIKDLLMHLKKFVKPVFQGFRGITGDNNAATGRGEVHFGDDIFIGEFKANFANGQGIYHFASGNYYEGTFYHGKRTGYGRLMMTNGDVYEGDFKLDDITGKGRYTYNDNSYYKGALVNGSFEGFGLRTYIDGTEYEGEWIANVKINGKFTQIDKSVYSGDFMNDMYNGFGTMVYANGDVYVGNWKDSNRMGHGAMTFNTRGGDVYEGDFLEDVIVGLGEYRFKNGDVYRGEFVDNILDGKGSYTYKDGSIFNGQFVNWKRCNYGEFIEPSGSKYTGDFIEERYHGDGVYESIEGWTYKGQFERGLKQGQGEYLYKDGSVYVGSWLNDQQHGKGQLVRAGYGTYKGDFAEGHLCGYGEYEYLDGSVYRGHFLESLYSGKGFYQYASGITYNGDYLCNLMHGEGQLKFVDGSSYRGEMADNLKEGIGEFLYANGNVYRGQYSKDLRHGVGTFEYSNGDVYIGDFFENKITGTGRFTWSNGNQFKGLFKDNLLVRGLYIEGTVIKQLYEGYFNSTDNYEGPHLIYKADLCHEVNGCKVYKKCFFINGKLV